MPLYEYQCDAGHRFELIRKFSDPPLETCPTCGGPVHKLFSSPAIQFKGSGFYITDYAKKDQETAAQPSESQSDTASKDKDKDKAEKTEKSEKGEKSEKSDKTEKGVKSDTGSSTTESASTSSSSTKESTKSTKDGPT